MRYTSVGPSNEALRSDLRRLGLLPCSKWRRPAPRKRTFPVAVILKRLATAFLVLIPLGRRIQFCFLHSSAQILPRSGGVNRQILCPFESFSDLPQSAGNIVRLLNKHEPKPRLQLCVGGSCLSPASIVIERRYSQSTVSMLPQAEKRQYLENALAILFSYGL